MIHRNDLLAYMVVLNHKPVLDRLSVDQINIGRQHMLGCLSRLMDQIEPESYLKNAIKERERLNAIHPVGQPQLAEATAKISELLHAYMIADDLIVAELSSCNG